jgi:DNA-binding transcriptional LysR family regulator
VPEQAMGGTCFEDFNLLRAAALSGQGVALCPPAMIGPDLGSGALMQLSDRHLDAGNQYYLLSATGLPPRQQQRVLLFRAWAMAERDAGP